MYLLKAKQRQEEEEKREALDRRRKAKEEQRRRQQGRAPGQTRPKPVIHKAEPGEKSKGRNKKAKYIGSFPVPTGSGRIQAGVVKEELGKLEVSKKAKTVIVVVQKEGVKILSEDEMRVYMAHAMFRISYTTFSLDKQYFAFVGKNPGGGTAASFCHVFKTDKREDAQDLNKMVGDAFKVTFAEQRERTMGRAKKPSPAVIESGMKTPAVVRAPQPVRPDSQPPPPYSGRMMPRAQIKPTEKSNHATQQFLLPPSNTPVQPSAVQPSAVQPSAVQPSAPMFDESESLKSAEWYQAGIPREIAVEILAQESDGAFLVRDSQSQPGCYVLSMKCPVKPGEKNGSIVNFLIVRTALGLNLKGLNTKCFPDLSSLIGYFATHPDGLPCQLHLNSSNPGFAADEDGIEDDLKSKDPDFSAVSDFDRILADLQSFST